MTLNGETAAILYHSPTAVALEANYVKLTEARPTMTATKI